MISDVSQRAWDASKDAKALGKRAAMWAARCAAKTTQGAHAYPAARDQARVARGLSGYSGEARWQLNLLLEVIYG